MPSVNTPVIPIKLEHARVRLERGRGTRRHRSRIPESLWAVAVELAREHGVFHAAKASHASVGKNFLLPWNASRTHSSWFSNARASDHSARPDEATPPTKGAAVRSQRS